MTIKAEAKKIGKITPEHLYFTFDCPKSSKPIQYHLQSNGESVEMVENYMQMLNRLKY